MCLSGITLDLGFSSFLKPAPKHLSGDFDHVQYTLVDCPGHASLIRTIIGGAQIIDLMMLVRLRFWILRYFLRNVKTCLIGCGHNQGRADANCRVFGKIAPDGLDVK